MGSDILEESLTDCTEAGNVDETVVSGAGVKKSCESPSMNANSLLSVRRARSRPSLFASVLQNSQPRRKLTSTTFLFFRSAFELEGELNAAWRYLKTSQFPVAARTDEISVNDDGDREDRYGTSGGGRAGWIGIIDSGISLFFFFFFLSFL